MSESRESLAHRGPLIVNGVRWCKRCMRERKIEGGGEMKDGKGLKYWACTTCVEKRSASVYSKKAPT